MAGTISVRRVTKSMEKEETRGDPIPSGGGIINGCQKIFFDSDHRPVITCHNQAP